MAGQDSRRRGAELRRPTLRASASPSPSLPSGAFACSGRGRDETRPPVAHRRSDRSPAARGGPPARPGRRGPSSPRRAGASRSRSRRSRRRSRGRSRRPAAPPRGGRASPPTAPSRPRGPAAPPLWTTSGRWRKAAEASEVARPGQPPGGRLRIAARVEQLSPRRPQRRGALGAPRPAPPTAPGRSSESSLSSRQNVAAGRGEQAAVELGLAAAALAARSAAAARRARSARRVPRRDRVGRAVGGGVVERRSTS